MSAARTDLRACAGALPVRPRALVSAAALAALVGAAVGCSSPSSESAAASASVGAPGFGDGPVVDRVVWSALDELTSCDVEHRGVVLDFGTDMIRGRARQRGEGAPMRVVEHDGATWSVVDERELEVSFVLSEPRRLFVSANMQPLAAKTVAFFVDGQPLATRKVKAGEPRVVETDATELPFDAGEHTLLLRFSPKDKGSAGYADIDWLRIGWPDDLKETFGAPTLPDLRQESAAVGKVPHRSLRLRAPTTLRCPLSVPRGARFRAALGLQGTTTADIEIVLRSDESKPTTVLKKTLSASEATAWLDVDASLDAFAGQLVQLELRATNVPATGRLLIGDPEVLVATAEPQPTPPAQVVIVVLMAGVGRSELPGYATRPLPLLENLTKLAGRASTYLGHRAVGSSPLANLATVLSGLSPRGHALADLGSSLSPAVPLIQQRARDASIQTAMFTAVPYSFAPFGLTRGMTHYVAISPVDGEGKDPVSEAATWLTSTLERAPGAKIFLVVHAPGAHPPFAVNQKQLDALPPENYTGDVQPRRAGQQLRAIRRKKHSFAALADGDRARLDALHQQALSDQDRALGQLLAAIDTANVEDKTLLVVTTDGSGTLENLFDDGPSVDERALELPLYVAFPAGRAAGRQVTEPTSVEDVAVTLAAALGVDRPQHAPGRDLMQVAAAVPLRHDAARVALFGDAATLRWGDFVLRQGKAKATLCQLSIDPTCTFDRRPVEPLLTQALTKELADYEAATQTGFESPAVTLDDPTLAALKVWGAME